MEPLFFEASTGARNRSASILRSNVLFRCSTDSVSIDSERQKESVQRPGLDAAQDHQLRANSSLWQPDQRRSWLLTPKDRQRVHDRSLARMPSYACAN
jgi:hypothetical protein